ncbi:MAG: OmpH family outer membrane protein [Candidatus Marinimicrobia bacterium]|nr:OmpH family outer membrane protein [Candidatus Neomarinimicrobiota bacterium]MCF7829227.1 OmpH family outer membrane protein [Candidatus Neomarinimicrobiota bacterium]MCF7881120.1 OmpH family outer membrane protein [Candidatus Neomarinimicrobiota bacterium]
MKRITQAGILLTLSVLMAVPALGQLKIAYVNSDRIMQEYEEAREAQKKMDLEAKQLENKYMSMTSQLDSLQRSFQQQQFVMSEERRQQKQQQIQSLQQRIQQFQMENVGPQGQIYAKQEQILGPVLQKINTAIKKVANDGSYDYVLDSVGGNILYAEEKHDITADVLYELRRGTSSSSSSSSQQ